MICPRPMLAIWLVASVLSPLPGRSVADENPLRSFFPYGVYVGGGDPEWSGKVHSTEDLQAAIERTCWDLREHHMNCAWPNNLAPDQVALWLEAGRKYGIRIVPQGGGPPMFVRPDWFADKEDFARQVEPFWQDMASRHREAPALLAWSLTEENEPVPWFYEAIAELTRKMAEWDSAHPMITLDNKVAAAWLNAQLVRPKAFCRDVYPFFADGLNGPYEAQGFRSYVTRECRRYQQLAKTCDAVYWHMGQAGQIASYGPGQEFVSLRYPTPEESRWQVWAAIQQGAKGFFYYLYQGPRGPFPPTRATYDEGLRDRNGAETPQYRMAAEVGRQLKTLGPLLLRLEPAAPHQDVVYWENTAVSAETFVDRDTGQRFIIAVNNDCKHTQRVEIELGLFIRTVRPEERLYDLKTRQALNYDTIKLATLQPGDGTIYFVGTDAEWEKLAATLYP